MEVISSWVTEMVGKSADNDESCDVSKENGTGCFLICVVTTEISPKRYHTCKECKNSTVILIGAEST